MLSGEKSTTAAGSDSRGAATQAPGPGSAVVGYGSPQRPQSTPPTAAPGSAGFASQKRARTESVGDHRTHDNVIAAAAEAASGRPEIASSPYIDLQQSVHAALESKDGPGLTTSDKVALALEVLRARQLELDLAQARNNIEALVTKKGSAPRTLRSVIPATTVKGLPVGTPVDISAGKFLLSPTTNDPQALFLTLELQHFGDPSISSGKPQDAQNVQREEAYGILNNTSGGEQVTCSVEGGEKRACDIQLDKPRISSAKVPEDGDE